MIYPTHSLGILVLPVINQKKTGDVRINVRLRSFRVTIFAVEKQ